MKRLITEKREKSGNRKRLSIVLALVTTLILLTTGCQTIKETFGKEYRRIDDFCEQLEADVRFTLEEFAATQELSAEQRSSFDTQMNLMAADINVVKAEMKRMVRGLKENADELGIGDSLDAYLEKALLEARVEIEAELKSVSNGQLVLKSTTVNRGFFGSIWHFIRNHWLISLIILGVISTIMESLGELGSRIFNRKKEDDE